VSKKKREPTVSSRAGIGGNPGIDDSEPLFKIARLLQDQVDLPIDDATRAIIGDPSANARNNSYFQRLQKKIKRNRPQWIAAQERAAQMRRLWKTDLPISIISHQSLSSDVPRPNTPLVVKGDALSAETKRLIKRLGRHR
jgi:hypothetical protein